MISENSLGMVIVGGDMNDTLSIIDRKKYSTNKKTQKPVNSLKNLIKTLKLIDIWRETHSNNTQFTWRRKNNINEASRIDLFLICPEIRSHICSADIRPALISHTDHQAISLKLKGRSQSKGKGYFKINNSILNNIEYRNIINGLIHKYKNNPKLTKNTGHHWDLFKIEVKEYTIEYCKRKAKQNISEIHVLENKIKKLNEKINKHCKDEEINNFKKN